MLTRSSLGKATALLGLAIPVDVVVFRVSAHAMTIAWDVFDLRLSACERMFPEWVVWPSTVVAFGVPVAAFGLAVAALLASLRKGYQPSVAPALRYAVAASATLGVLAPLMVLAGAAVGQPFYLAELVLTLGLAAVYALLHLAPVSMLNLPWRRIAIPSAVVAGAYLLFFSVAWTLTPHGNSW